MFWLDFIDDNQADLILEDGTIQLWQGDDLILEDGTIQLWQGDDPELWLQVACDRLRFHPVFKEQQTDLVQEAYATCLQYVWNKSGANP
jgi:hypothetical protein